MGASSKLIIGQLSQNDAVLCIKNANGETEQVAIKNKVPTKADRHIGDLTNSVLQQLKENQND